MESVEEEIQRKGLTAPRITPAHIESKIADIDFVVFGTLTICVVTLINGTRLTGESACVSIENYDRAVGERIARENAVRKIWPLEGYLLAERKFQGAGATKSCDEAERTTSLTIGEAVRYLRNRHRVRRAGWNGKGMYLALQVPDAHSKMSLPYVFMKTVDDKLVPWLCSQTDLLATDWELAI